MIGYWVAIMALTIAASLGGTIAVVFTVQDVIFLSIHYTSYLSSAVGIRGGVHITGV